MVKDVVAVLAIDALLQGLGVIAFRVLVAENKVHTGLVESDGIDRREDSDVLQARFVGMGVTVAID